MSLAEVKAHLSEVVHRVSAQHERVTLTVHGTPSAVLVAPDDLESLEETLAILSHPDTMRRVSDSDQELAGGGGEPESDLVTAMKSPTSQARALSRSRTRSSSPPQHGVSLPSDSPRPLRRPPTSLSSSPRSWTNATDAA